MISLIRFVLILILYKYLFYIDFVNCPELLKNISENYKYWTEQLEVENAAKSDNEENEKKTESFNSS